MQIVCPHCQTAYGIRAESIGPAGRTVRCARCKNTWLVLPETESVGAGMAAGDSPAGPDPQFSGPGPGMAGDASIPAIDSPPLAADMPAPGAAAPPIVDAVAGAELGDGSRPAWTHKRRPKVSRPPPIMAGAIAAMAALSIGLVAWRSDIVRLMPQTGAFFRVLGLGVNLRGIEIENIKVSTDKVDGTTMMLVEGELYARRNTEVPRLRFAVRDARGVEIQAWNAALEQPTLHVGERAPFQTILAAPPPEAREITVRFLQKNDMSSGGR